MAPPTTGSSASSSLAIPETIATLPSHSNPLSRPEKSSFYLRIHYTKFTNHNSKISELIGTVHLYRNIKHTLIPNPNSQESSVPFELTGLYRNIKHSLIPNPNSQESSVLFVVAVPSNICSDDFLRFCGSYNEHVTEFLFIRYDGIEDRYSVLIRLVDEKRADDFYSNFNGRRFSSTGAEVCHILYSLSVNLEYTESAELAGTAPPGFNELPTCPVCLERLDQDTSGILMTLHDHSFKSPCISKWTDSSCPVCRLCQQQAEKPTCSICGLLSNIWICIICGFVGCGRYNECHAMLHWKATQHCYCIDSKTRKVWDYIGDTYLNPSKTEGEMNSYCRSFDGDCRDPECSEESGISRIVLSSKIEAIVDEYNHFFVGELKNCRKHYEKQLAEITIQRERSIFEAVDIAVNEKIQNKIEETVKRKKEVVTTNENLLKEQEIWRKMVEEIEERERSTLKSKDKQIADLEEQIASKEELSYLSRCSNLPHPTPKGAQKLTEDVNDCYL